MTYRYAGHNTLHPIVGIVTKFMYSLTVTALDVQHEISFTLKTDKF